MKRKKRSLCNKICGSWQERHRSWHVQQQQRFRLKKQNFYIDAHGRFYHGARRSSRAGSCSGFRQVSHSTGTIKYRRLIDQFSCFILKVRKFPSSLSQSALTLATRIRIIRKTRPSLVQTSYFIVVPLPLWTIY